MDATHIHLIFTHFPIVGTFIGVGILAYGLFAKNNEIQKVALGVFILMALTSIIVYLSGESAEEKVEHLAGVSERAIENHEELAEKAIWMMGLLGALSLLNFLALIKEISFVRKISLITLFVSALTFGLFAQVGNLGGQIRHTEIRSGSNTQSDAMFSGEKHEKHEEHDDDD